jgi:hypothetical protein
VLALLLAPAVQPLDAPQAPDHLHRRRGPPAGRGGGGRRHRSAVTR